MSLVLAVWIADAVAVDSALPDPLRLADVTAIALANRAEVSAANARADALAQRPAIVSALEDPMVSASIDHYPYDKMMDARRRYDRSFTIEQKFPLSRIRSHRRDAARADAQRARALADTTGLDVILEVQRSFFMVLERRRMQGVIDEQASLARQLVSAAAGRYASGTGMQADVLRAEVEVARLQAQQQALAAQIRGAEVMLNAGLGRPAEAAIPALDYTSRDRQEPAAPVDALDRAAASRPELAAGAAEVDRTNAEIEVMRSMYKPMAMVRIGQAETMAEGSGAMFMVGVSIPIWRERLSAGVSEARAMQQMADADLEAMRRMVASEVLAAREEVNAVRSQARVLETEVLPRALAAVDAALAGYAAGQGTLVAVIESARALWEVQSEQVMIESDLGEAWARLERAMGTIQDTRQ
ncbi:TolC family protein [Azotobacter vinelandii]|uniref:TolC family protein n=1 Tax=Azotobacter vinelandii TaxID=354 RepID=UPI0026656D4D|nr:TolC family protein [Azotobacter vinelandii]WKN21108.1 TolC family protein [Azotobacter vinelandii]